MPTETLAKRIETAVTASSAAVEAGDFATAVTKLQSAVILMAGHPRIKFEDTETEYVRDELVSLLRELKKERALQANARSSSGGMTSIPIIGER